MTTEVTRRVPDFQRHDDRGDRLIRTAGRRALLTVVALLVCLPAGGASALGSPWPWADAYTDVSATNRTFTYRQPSAATGQKSVHELSARRNRDDDARGRAGAAVRTRLETPVFAERLRVNHFGRSAEGEVDPPARLKAYVHCVGEVESEWVLIGARDVEASAATQTMSRSISTEDCETQTEDGVMLQVLAGERGDRKRRTVFLEKAELGPVGAPVWSEDFTVP